MRTAKMTIDGREHLLCFSTRVIRSCCGRYGEFEKLNEATSTGDQEHDLSEAMWILAQMLDAGGRYAKLNGIENPEPPTLEQLYDLCDLNDFAMLRGKIRETISNGQKQNVMASPPKNTDATPGGR